jgi:hypothetical protein
MKAYTYASSAETGMAFTNDSPDVVESALKDGQVRLFFSLSFSLSLSLSFSHLSFSSSMSAL